MTDTLRLTSENGQVLVLAQGIRGRQGDQGPPGPDTELALEEHATREDVHGLPELREAVAANAEAIGTESEAREDALGEHAALTEGVHGLDQLAEDIAAAQDAAEAAIQEGDSRLTDSRAPSGAAGGVLSGNFPNPEMSTSFYNNLAWALAFSGNANKATSLLLLDGQGKVPAAQLPNSVMDYKGAWNASTNSPALADGAGSAGDVYVVSTAGTRNLGSGSQVFAVKDWVVYTGTVWEKVDNTDDVTSVAGRTGAVTLAAADITDFNAAVTPLADAAAIEQIALWEAENAKVASNFDSTLVAEAGATFSPIVFVNLGVGGNVGYGGTMEREDDGPLTQVPGWAVPIISLAGESVEAIAAVRDTTDIAKLTLDPTGMISVEYFGTAGPVDLQALSGYVAASAGEELP